MSNTAKQFALIERLKKLVASTGRHLLGRKNRPHDNDISEKIAQKIQKTSYDLSQKVVKDTFTPPYQKLAEQLEVDEPQIFKAAVYNMANIAMHRKKYRRDIMDIFSRYLSDYNLSNEKKDYIKSKMDKILSMKA